LVTEQCPVKTESSAALVWELWILF
jgi:hypothetical protein